MPVTAEGGVPVHAGLHPGQRNEGAVVAETLAAVPAPPRPAGSPPVPLLADRMYDGDNWRDDLRALGYDLVCRHRKNRKRPKRQDGRKLPRLKRRRWLIERTFAWLKAYRRVAARYDRRADLYLAAVQLTCGLICLRYF